MDRDEQDDAIYADKLITYKVRLFIDQSIARSAKNQSTCSKPTNSPCFPKSLNEQTLAFRTTTFQLKSIICLYFTDPSWDLQRSIIRSSFPTLVFTFECPTTTNTELCNLAIVPSYKVKGVDLHWPLHGFH